MVKTVSVIIVTYNSDKHIYDCLDSIFKYNDIGEALEVIIVDNQSENFPKTKEELKKRYNGRLIILENDRNGGYGQGNNVGIRAASAPIVLIMNPDVRLLEPIFKNALDAFRNPKVVQYGVRALNKDGKNYNSIGISEQIHPFVRLPLHSICNKTGWFFQKYMYLIGACFFIRKSSFEEVGLFDERIFMYGEEDDIHYRLLKKNKQYKFIFDSSHSYTHLHGLYAQTKKFDDVKGETLCLNSYLLLLSERGIPKRSIINSFIRQTQIRLFKAKIKSIITNNGCNFDEIQHLELWLLLLKKEQQKYIDNI